jgi:secreted Zn-dependent insulinase-like peptidase
MSKSKLPAEKIEIIQEQIRQLENEKKKLLQQKNEQDRKARTKRLIERGAILESLIDSAETLTNEQIKSFLEKTIQSEYARRILSNVKAQSTTEVNANSEIQQSGNSGATSENAEITPTATDES